MAFPIGAALGGAVEGAKNLGEAGYLEDTLAGALAIGVGSGLTRGFIPQAGPFSPRELGYRLKGTPGLGFFATQAESGINRWTAPFLQEMGLIEGQPEMLKYPMLGPQELGLGGLQESLVGKMPSVTDKPLSGYIGLALGGVLPEDVEGVGPSGTRYKLEKGETVMPTRNEDPYFTWGPMDKPSIGARLGGFFGDPRVQLALAQAGQAISPPGTMGEQLGGFAATSAQAVMAEQHQVQARAGATQEREAIVYEARQQWEKEKKKEHDDAVKKALEKMKTEALQTRGPISGQAAAPSIGPSLAAYGGQGHGPIAPF